MHPSGHHLPMIAAWGVVLQSRQQRPLARYFPEVAVRSLS
jgi:hypothetical protein